MDTTSKKTVLRKHFEFVTIKLTYKPDLDPKSERMSCVLKKSPAHGPLMQLEWFAKSMRQAAKELPPRSLIRFMEWHIFSDEVDLFTIKDVRYDEIMLIIGEHNISWMFYDLQSNEVAINGLFVLPITHCGCCIGAKYAEILQHVKRNAINPKYCKIKELNEKQ